MDYIIKILLRIIMCVKNKIKPEIAEKQYGFVESRSKTNATYILQNIIE